MGLNIEGVEVPLEVEAKGGEAIDAYVKEKMAPQQDAAAVEKPRRAPRAAQEE